MTVGTISRILGVSATAIVLLLASGGTATAATLEDSPRVEPSSIFLYGEPLGRTVEILWGA